MNPHQNLTPEITKPNSLTFQFSLQCLFTKFKGNRIRIFFLALLFLFRNSSKVQLISFSFLTFSRQPNRGKEYKILRPTKNKINYLNNYLFLFLNLIELPALHGTAIWTQLWSCSSRSSTSPTWTSFLSVSAPSLSNHNQNSAEAPPGLEPETSEAHRSSGRPRRHITIPRWSPIQMQAKRSNSATLAHWQKSSNTLYYTESNELTQTVDPMLSSTLQLSEKHTQLKDRVQESVFSV